MSNFGANDFNLEDINKITDVALNIKLLEDKVLRLEQVLEYLSEGIEISDEKGNIIYVNQKFHEMTGIQSEERLHKNIFEMNPDGVLTQVLTRQEPILNAITTAPGMEGRGIANGYPLFKNGKLIGAALFVKDVSQAIQLSKKLNERESFLTEFYRRTAKYYFSDIVYRDPRMKEAVLLSKQMAANKEPVVLIGEKGTGKNLLVQAIHNGSLVNKKPLLKFNCAEFTEDRKVIELFGCKKNALPEAVTDRLGLLEIVNGGTIYFENLHELSISTQSMLIASLKNGSVTRIGETSSNPVHFRFIASLEEPLINYYANGLIQKDLYLYLKNHCITIPPLRERKEDLPELVDSLILKSSRNLGKHVKGIRHEALELLVSYNWPGNVKELAMVIEMIILTLDSTLITPEHVLSRLPFEFKEKMDRRVIPLEKMERTSLINALELYGDSLQGKKKAAEALQISLGTLYNKMKKYDI